jgi:hypothetical protein
VVHPLYLKLIKRIEVKYIFTFRAGIARVIPMNNSYVLKLSQQDHSNTYTYRTNYKTPLHSFSPSLTRCRLARVTRPSHSRTTALPSTDIRRRTAASSNVRRTCLPSTGTLSCQYAFRRKSPRTIRSDCHAIRGYDLCGCGGWAGSRIAVAVDAAAATEVDCGAHVEACRTAGDGRERG